tara:strand:- start:2964 stop:3185 length:222 start_codon:yes stop_codon:yes gene_type:complete
MKIKLKGQCVDIKKNSLEELTRLQKIIIQEIKLNDRKVRGQLLDLSLGIVNKRITDISYDLAYANEINTVLYE